MITDNSAVKFLSGNRAFLSEVCAITFFHRSEKMKRILKVISSVATIAAIAMIGVWMISNRAAAQQKNPLAPLLVRNIDEPGFNPFQASQNILFTNFSGDATFQIP